MTYKEALAFVGAQEKKISKVNNMRFEHDGYEYKVVYEGGFTAFVAIYRRPVGKRNFKYFGGVAVFDCMSVGEAVDKIMRRIGRAI